METDVKPQEITIQVKQIYSKEEIKKVDEAQIQFGLNMALIDKLTGENHITYWTEPDLFGKIEAIAEIKIIQK